VIHFLVSPFERLFIESLSMQ